LLAQFDASLSIGFVPGIIMGFLDVQARPVIQPIFSLQEKATPA
jgi:hypothetical protein